MRARARAVAAGTGAATPCRRAGIGSRPLPRTGGHQVLPIAITDEALREAARRTMHDPGCASLRPGYMVGGIIYGDLYGWRRYDGVVEVKAACNCRLRAATPFGT